MPTIVYFDLPVDVIERAKKFYGELFDWKIEKIPEPLEYYSIETTTLSGEEGLSGGMAKRENADQKITTFIGVPSVDECIDKVEILGGKVLEPKTAVAGLGFYAIFNDTENNTIGLWEEDKNTK
ncbi:VOC family protein [Methanococcoides alaskense]|uniref:Enzyme related to lactoylglutathione lyase n=1 Tax=Methanococcoides alaskense TaxID=325778 RepID=A0AA90TX80_9EURY|nr:VOC family protein [Methanococcoides alaskense]MDA0525382.1 VOC family protein [Methanococcoides alaskense]MDR6221687.1 putative enzyme related to lactoylglutathione lyase [Methanococcoides alaskense]